MKIIKRGYEKEYDENGKLLYKRLLGSQPTITEDSVFLDIPGPAIDLEDIYEDAETEDDELADYRD